MAAAKATRVLPAAMWIRAGGFDAIIEMVRLGRWGKVDIHDPPAVYQCVSFVWWNFIPLGFHVALFDTVEGMAYEGRHVSKQGGLGSPFALIRRPRAYMKCMFAVPAKINPTTLPDKSSAAKPYNFAWNCQIAIAGIYARNPRALLGIAGLLIWVGSAWAVAILLFVLVSLSFALSTSLTALMAFDALNIPGIEELRKAIEWMGALADTLSYTGLGNDY